MAAFKKSGGFKKPSFGRSSGGRDSRPHQMYSATCAKCRKSCEVPFRPNGEKPVLCRDCFGGSRDASPRSQGGPTPRPFQKREFTPASSFRPAGGESRIDELARQIAAMNKKIDTMLAIIQK